MKTLLAALRIADLDRSLTFYTAIGYETVGFFDMRGGGRLAVLKFPDEAVGTLELMCPPSDGPVDIGTGFNHLVIQADDLSALVDQLTAEGLEPDPIARPAGPAGPVTSWLTDPDGYRIELVQWPAGHPDGVTAADFS